MAALTVWSDVPGDNVFGCLTSAGVSDSLCFFDDVPVTLMLLRAVFGVSVGDHMSITTCK